MIIRSQNKKSIANLNNIDSICIESNCCGCEVVGYNGTQESCVKLGEYSTEEKAIKVLDMMENTCRNIAFIDEKAVVFAMPQDSEV